MISFGRMFATIGIVLCFASTGLVLAGVPVVDLVMTGRNPAPGDTFSIALHVTKAPPFANWAEVLRFDTARVRLVSQSAGTFSTFISDSRQLDDINATGEVRTGGFGFEDNRGGSGTLGVFSFKRLAMGSAVFTADIKSKKSPFGLIFKTSNGKILFPAKVPPLVAFAPTAVIGEDKKGVRPVPGKE